VSGGPSVVRSPNGLKESRSDDDTSRMSSTSGIEPLPRLASHGLAAPTGADFRDALQRTAGPDAEEVWARVCAATGVPPRATLLPVEQLAALALALAAIPGPVGLTGRALAVRVASYRQIASEQLETEGSARPYDWGRASYETLLRRRPPDVERLQQIADLEVFSPGNRDHLDAAARRAAEALGTGIGLVTVVLDEANCVAGSHGLPSAWAATGGSPVEWAFCATPVRTREAYVVPDVGAHVIERHNPLALGIGIRTYTGVPLITSSGVAVGALCVMGTEPLEADCEQVADLRRQADELVAGGGAGAPPPPGRTPPRTGSSPDPSVPKHSRATG
jgi:hypothetical protein